MNLSPSEAKLKNGLAVILRSPKVEESELLLRHLRINFSESYRNMNSPADFFDNFPVEEEQKILSEFTESKTKFMLSAFHEGAIVGNLGCFGIAGAFHKHNARIGMGNQLAFCGIGLGTELLNRAFGASKEMGFRRLELNVRTFNHAGIALYEKHGFERVGLLTKVAFIDGEDYDEFVYQKHL